MAKCRNSLVHVVGVAVIKTVLLAVRSVLEAATKGKSQARAHKLHTEVERMDAQDMERDEVITSPKVA